MADSSKQDDWYEGYFIPKGTIIIPNVWEMNHDPSTFGDDAHLFNPNRFLDEKGEMLSSLSGAREDGHYSYGVLSSTVPRSHLINS